MNIRLFRKGDAEQVAQLFGNTVRIIDEEEYPKSESKAWMFDDVQYQRWEENCLNNFTIVAETDDAIVALAQFEDNGHINGFYCHPDSQRQGIGRQLYEAIEDYARSKNISPIYTEANPSTRTFFIKMGFSHVQKLKVLVRGEMVSVYIMEKNID